MSMIGRVALAIGTMAMATGCATAQAPVQRLYPGKAPGSESWARPQAIQVQPDGDQAYYNTVDPELTAYPADPARANGAAVVLLPGGGLRMLSIGSEARDIIDRFNREGISVFVLKYRTLQMDVPPPRPAGSSGPIKFPKMEVRNGNANPAPGNAALNEVLRLATDDAQSAMRYVRSNAARWKIDPAKVGLIGSSAGGGVAMSLLHEREDGTMPAFIMSLYGPSLQDVTVAPDAPPLFMATESDHGPVTDGLLALFSMWKNADRKVELHVFEVPNFQMPPSLYIDRAVAFLREQDIIPATQP
jgi:acetyl esterase/lipase